MTPQKPLRSAPPSPVKSDAFRAKTPPRLAGFPLYSPIPRDHRRPIMTAFPSPLLGIGLGTPEILIIAFLVLLLFGAKKLPELAKGFGKSVSEFKKASKEAEDEDEKPAETKVASSKSHGLRQDT